MSSGDRETWHMHGLWPQVFTTIFTYTFQSNGVWCDRLMDIFNARGLLE
jgi:ribonuclease I